MDEQPHYSLWTGSELGYKVPNSGLVPVSPNSSFITGADFPFLPSGKGYKVRLASFKIQKPNNENSGYTRGYMPWDEVTATNVEKTTIGMMIIEPVTDPPMWKNLGNVNAMINYQTMTRQIMGTFNALDGSEMQSSWQIITAPLNTSAFRVTLCDASGIDYLIDRTGGGVPKPIANWVAELQFAPLTVAEERTYFPYRNPQTTGDLVFNYPDEIFTPDPTLIAENTPAAGEIALTDAYITISKQLAGNGFFNCNTVILQARSAIGNGPVTLKFDVYYNIADPAAETVADAFAGFSPAATGSFDFVVPESGGLETVTINTTGNDNYGRPVIYLVFKDAATDSTTLPAGLFIDAVSTTEEGIGLTNGGFAEMRMEALGYPFFGLTPT